MNASQHFDSDFYEKRALYVERYRSPYFWESRYHRKRMKYVMHLIKLNLSNRRFLDVGCGTGEYLTGVSNLGFEVIGIDVSLNYLRRAKARCAAAHLVQVDVNALPFRNNQIDLTLCSEVLEHVPKTVDVLHELLRVTRKVLIITTPNYGLLRRMIARVSKSYLKKLDDKVGHINVLHLNWLCEKINSTNWKVESSKTIHVTPPIVGNTLHIPRVLSSFFSVVEQAFNVLFPEMGNISLITCKELTDEDGTYHP